jgi:hypothetical protein
MGRDTYILHREVLRVELIIVSNPERHKNEEYNNSGHHVQNGEEGIDQRTGQEASDDGPVKCNGNLNNQRRWKEEAGHILVQDHLYHQRFDSRPHC